MFGATLSFDARLQASASVGFGCVGWMFKRMRRRVEPPMTTYCLCSDCAGLKMGAYTKDLVFTMKPKVLLQVNSRCPDLNLQICRLEAP